MRKICQKTILGIFHVKGTFSKSQLDCWKRYFARSISQRLHPVVIDLFKVNNGNRTIFEICLKIIETLERRHRRRCGAFIVNFEQISYIGLVFLLLTLNKQKPAGYWSTVNFGKAVENIPPEKIFLS